MTACAAPGGEIPPLWSWRIAQEGILGYAVRLVGTAGQSAARAIDTYLAGLQRLVECLVIATPEPPDQLGFAHFATPSTF
jgi:hypothetical protein